MTVQSLRKVRVRRAIDARDISEAELLRDLADQIDEGAINPKGVSVVIRDELHDGRQQVRVHRAQITITEEAGLLTVAQIDSARVLTGA